MKNDTNAVKKLPIADGSDLDTMLDERHTHQHILKLFIFTEKQILMRIYLLHV